MDDNNHNNNNIIDHNHNNNNNNNNFQMERSEIFSNEPISKSKPKENQFTIEPSDYLEYNYDASNDKKKKKENKQ